jgi:hypothetical protein
MIHRALPNVSGIDRQLRPIGQTSPSDHSSNSRPSPCHSIKRKMKRSLSVKSARRVLVLCVSLFCGGGVEGWAAGLALDPTGGSAVKVVALVLGTGGVFGLLRAYLQYRGRIESERQRTYRLRYRSLALSRIVRALHPGVRVVTRDADGHVYLIESGDAMGGVRQPQSTEGDRNDARAGGEGLDTAGGAARAGL